MGANPHLALTKMADHYGHIYSIKLGSRLAVVINGASAIRDGLLKRSYFFAGRPALFSLEVVSGGGHGLAFAGYSRKWTILRRICEKAVHGSISNGIVYGKIKEESRRLVQFFQRLEGKPLNILHGIHFATANVMLCLLFDTSFEYDNEDLLEILEDEHAFQDAMGLANAVDLFPWLKYFTSSNTTKRLQRLADNLLNMIEKLYRNSKRDYQPGIVRCLADSLITAAEVGSQSNKENNLTEKDLIHTLFDMFGAGFDTIALTIHWAAAYLIVYSDIQRELHQELDRALPKGRPPTFEDRNKLPLLQATIYELLRITSLLPEAIPHSTTADLTIAGYTIPKDTLVLVNLWSANHDPKVWKDPDVFNPKRFLDEEGHVFDPKDMPSFLPFSAGRRKCLGESLAYMELFAFLGILLQNFRFTQEGLDPNQQGVNLTPKFGIGLAVRSFFMRLVPRELQQMDSTKIK